MKVKRKTGPPPLPKKHKRVLNGVTLSPTERKAIDQLRGDVPFSTWVRGVLMENERGEVVPSAKDGKWNEALVTVPGKGCVRYGDLTDADRAAIDSERDALPLRQLLSKREYAAVCRAAGKASVASWAREILMEAATKRAK